MVQARHCALSLVGEPIMYPAINELIDHLHSRRISTFLVTNAQFPDCIECAPSPLPLPPHPPFRGQAPTVHLLLNRAARLVGWGRPLTLLCTSTPPTSRSRPPA